MALHEAQITLLAKQIHEREATLHPVLLPTADVQRLLWIPGIGKVNAFTIWTEIDGVARFPSEKQILSYCRLVPGAKQGNRYLKMAFSHAGVPAIRYYPVIKTFYQRQRRRKPVVVAAELGRFAYQVLAKQEDLNATFRGVPLHQTKTRPWPRSTSPVAA